MSQQENSPCHDCNKPYHRDDFRYGGGGGSPNVCDECKEKKWEEEREKSEKLRKLEEAYAKANRGSARQIPSNQCEFCGKVFQLSEEDFVEHQEFCKAKNN